MFTPPKRYRHKPSGQDRVRVNGRDVYIGPSGSEQADQNYRRIITELSSGAYGGSESSTTISELVASFLRWAERNYRGKDGLSTGSYERYIVVVRPLVALYGDLPVNQFGPKSLKTVREDLVQSGRLCRKMINERIGLLRYIFRWGVSEELVPETIYRALATVSPLKEGKTEAIDHPPVEQVSLDDVLKTVAVAHKTLGDMIRIQLLSGMRPQEVRLIRACDIDTSDDVWVYSPPKHKTAHKGKWRPIPLIPESQAILAPYLIDNEDEPEAYLFSPKKAMRMIAIEQRAQRKSKVQPSQQGKRKGRGEAKPIGDFYTKDSYGKAVKAAAKRAGVPPWSPNQLRHTRATDVNERLGIEAAQRLLGHSSPKTTEIYLDPNVELKRQVEQVKDVARKIVADDALLRGDD